MLRQLDKSSKLYTSGMLIFLLLILQTACGTSVVTTPSAVKPHSSSTVNKLIETPTATPSPSPTATLSPSPTVFGPNAKNVAEDIGSLRIQSLAGFQCPNDPANAIGPQDQLVFTSDPTTYSQNEIAQIRSYMGSNSPGAEVPSTLNRVLGGSVDLIPGAENGNIKYYVPCGADLVLTNLGSTPIQIPQVGVQLESSPKQNSYQYRLIDACSLVAQGNGPCPPLGGAGITCSRYLASIQLGQGEKDTVYSAIPEGTGDNCGTLTIAPSNSAHLILIFSLAANIPHNLMYSIEPVLTVDTAQGKQSLPLPQLGNTLVFASAKQFSCYTLQGTAFVLLKSPSSPPNWCI